MKGFLIISDNPDEPGAINIDVMRQFSEAELLSNTGPYDTQAGKYLLALESLLMDLRHATKIAGQLDKLAKTKATKCSH